MPARLFATGTILLALILSGCGAPTADVSGRVTCKGKAIPGIITFTPVSEDGSNTGTVPATVNDDGSYTLTLRTVGKHYVVVSPADQGRKEYPCDLARTTHEIMAGKNEINVDLKHRGK